MLNRALVLLAAVAASHTPLWSVGAQTMSPPERSPATAALLGALLPGAGHFYAGEKLRAAGFFLVTAENIGTAIYVNNRSGCDVGDGFFRCDGTGSDDNLRRAVVTLSAITGAVAWIGSAIDAPRAVRRERERQRARSAMLDSHEWRLVLAPAGNGTTGWRVGLSGRW